METSSSGEGYMPDSTSSDQSPENLEQQNELRVVNQSGGIGMDANNVQVGADVVGRDKIESAGGHIIHAEPGSTVIIGELATREAKGQQTASANAAVSVSSRLITSKVFWIFVIGLAVVVFLWLLSRGWINVSKPNNVEASATRVAAYLTQLPQCSECPRANIYPAHAGDTLTTVANAYGVSPDLLSGVNALPRNVVLSANQQLIILIPDERFSTPTPTIEHRVYVVEPGDTLDGIAHRFSVSVTALLAINNLTNADLVSIGQMLIIPDESITVISSPTPIRPQPVALGDAFVTIREISGRGDLAQESIILTNIGAKTNLAGWTLSDGKEHEFIFPDLVLLTNADISLHTTGGTNTSNHLYWGRSEPLWMISGTVAFLRDPDDRLIATYRVP
jgi:LysM repeat protein